MSKIAFIGFGEAAQSIAAGLASEGRNTVAAAFDPRFADKTAGPLLRERADASGVRAAATTQDAVAGSDVILSLVSGSVAVDVARNVGSALRSGQIYVDLNSISPEGKRRAGEALAVGGNGDFVEGAVMARVPPQRHKTPILLAGEKAEGACRILNDAGMVCEAVGNRIGQASTVKMIRSIFIKGVEALLIESLTAAERAGVRERIMDSISETFPGIDWREQATYYVGRTREHGARRVNEMNESAETLTELDMKGTLSRAIATTIGDAYAAFQTAELQKEADYAAMVTALAQARSAAR